jgi:single-stranded-DNA-specific exonuclease
LVITDHHALAAERPDAHALVNPELATPVERWAGAGVALQVVRALWGEEVPRRFYGICAIGTVADVVPMTTNNRRVVQRGLAALSDGQVPGVSALLRAAGRDLAHVSAEDLGFVVAPMINAAGRLGDATPAVELLLQDRVEAAAEWAQWLVQKNRERRTLQDRMLREAWAVLARDQHGRIFPFAVAAQAGWHEGLVGIVASRLKDLLKRPVAVISWDPSRKVGKGSARGVEGLDLISHLRRHAQHFINLGGHPGACGFSLRYQDASQLSQVFSRGLPAEALAQQHRDVRYDLRVQAAELTGRVARELKRLEPFGRGFERPRFLIHASVETAQAVGKDGGHLRLKLRDLPFPVVGFHLGHYAGGLASGQPVQFVGEMRWSLFRGREQPEVHIVAWDQSAPRVPSVTPAPGWPPPSAARRVFIVESTHAVIRVAEREHAIPFLPYATVAQWVDDVQRCRERDSGRIVVSQWRPWPPLWGWADAVVWLTRPVTRRRLEESGAFLRAGGQVWMADGTTTPERVSEKARRLLPTRDKLGRHWRRWGQGSSGLMIGRQIFRELGLDPGKPVLSGKVALASSFSYQWTWWAYREAVALGADHLSGREATRPPGESPSASG